MIRSSAHRAQSTLDVRRLAEFICQDLRSKDYLSEYLAIYLYVLGNTRYMRDPKTVELVKSPDLVAREILAGGRPQIDCDEMTALICALVMAVGGKCRIVTVAFRHLFYKGQRQYTHVFAQAMDPRLGQWITLDPVAGPQSKSMINRTVAAKVWPL